MSKDILLYGRISEESIRDFFECIAEAYDIDEAAELVFRINTGGGEPEYGWGAAAKINETLNKKVKVDGKAYSWGAFACCYAEDVECLDVSQFMIHRAAYSEWFESSEYFTEPLQENLSAINAKLEKAFRNKVDVEAFENLKQVKDKGITVKDIFSMEGRIDVFFSATDAKKIGLVKNIVQLTPAKKAEIETLKETAKAAKRGERVSVESNTDEPKNTDMTLEELKAKFPALYSQVMAEGHKQGVEAEKERVEAIMVFIDIDPAACKTAIESGKGLSAKQINEIALKSFSAEKLKAVETDSADDVVTDEIKDDPKKSTKENDNAKKLAEFEKETNKRLGLKVA